MTIEDDEPSIEVPVRVLLDVRAQLQYVMRDEKQGTEFRRAAAINSGRLSYYIGRSRTEPQHEPAIRQADESEDHAR